MAELKLPCGRIALIDDADLPLVKQYNWYSFRGYVRGRPPKQRKGWIFLHKFITGYAMTDHRDGDGLNNQRANLRPCSKSENCCNAKKRKSTKLFKGVFFNSRKGRWQVQVYKDGVCHSGGYHETAEQAALAYDDLALQLHGEFARLNFPEPERAPKGCRITLRSLHG